MGPHNLREYRSPRLYRRDTKSLTSPCCQLASPTSPGTECGLARRCSPSHPRESNSDPSAEETTHRIAAIRCKVASLSHELGLACALSDWPRRRFFSFPIRPGFLWGARAPLKKPGTGSTTPNAIGLQDLQGIRELRSYRGDTIKALVRTVGAAKAVCARGRQP